MTKKAEHAMETRTGLVSGLVGGLAFDREGSHHLARARAIEDLNEAMLKKTNNTIRLRELRLARDKIPLPGH